MSWCDDPDKHEREGRDAGRWGEGYGFEHRERMREARWGSPDSCDAAYAKGYERERRYQEDLRREEQEREEAEQRHQQRLDWEREQERIEYEAAFEQQMEQEQYPDPDQTGRGQ